MANKSKDKLYKRQAKSKKLDYMAWSQIAEDNNQGQGKRLAEVREREKDNLTQHFHNDYCAKTKANVMSLREKEEKPS